MKRNLYIDLLKWKSAKNRKPLIIRGARQVGKTWLLKSFGKQEYKHCIYLNFEEEPRLNDFFQEKLDPNTILSNIALYLNITFSSDDTLLIFDEIQASLAALNSLKYFQEQANQFHIVAAGSLLGVKLGKTNGFPVGKVTFLDLYPLSFSEFLNAIGKEKIVEYLSKINDANDAIPDPLHEELLQYLKQYMIVGGMPEAVLEFINVKDYSAVRKIQQDILDAYTLDFAKHAPKEIIMKIKKVWESIPAQLARENKKFKWSTVQEDARAREFETTVEWLADAGLIYRSFLVSTPRFPLSAYSEPNTFKIFLVDVGLLAAMSRLSAQIILEGNSLFVEFKGSFTENLVAQALAVEKIPLYYWASEGRAEVDFLVEDENDIYPLEVKSGTSSKMKSLAVYEEKFKPGLMLRASPLNLKKDARLLNIPLYLINNIRALLK